MYLAEGNFTHKYGLDPALSLDEYKTIFSEYTLHRYNEIMADVFYSAVPDVANKYDGDAYRIWCNNLGSAKVVYESLQFKGVGVKIATMAANILARQFKIPFRTIIQLIFFRMYIF